MSLPELRQRNRPYCLPDTLASHDGRFGLLLVSEEVGPPCCPLDQRQKQVQLDILMSRTPGPKTKPILAFSLCRCVYRLECILGFDASRKSIADVAAVSSALILDTRHQSIDHINDQAIYSRDKFTVQIGPRRAQPLWQAILGARTMRYQQIMAIAKSASPPHTARPSIDLASQEGSLPVST